MYVCPTIKIVKTDLEYQLLTGSNMSGGHNSGTIAPPVSNAKQVFFEDEAEEDSAVGKRESRRTHPALGCRLLEGARIQSRPFEDSFQVHSMMIPFNSITTWNHSVASASTGLVRAARRPGHHDATRAAPTPHTTTHRPPAS